MTEPIQLKTTAAVIDFLGGEILVADMFETPVKPKAVGNWRYFGYFPAHTYTALRDELRRRNATAPDKLWAMSTLKRQRQKA